MKNHINFIRSSGFILSSIFTILAVFSSCSKILDQEPQASVSDQGVISDGKTALSALYGIYDNLQSSIQSEITAFSLASDNVISSSDPTIIVPDRNMDNTGGAPFSTYYVSINRANFIIKHVPEVTDPQFADKDRRQILGEAYFLRALAYFSLARFFGGVQIVTEPSERIDSHNGVTRSSLEETYAQVSADLDQAEQLITDETNKSRATIFAVYALKARLFVYTEKWEQAEEYATKSINSPNFQLVKPYTSFYTGSLTKEAIFEVTFTTADPTTYWRSWLSTEDGGSQTYLPSPSLTQDLLDPAKGGARANVIKQSTATAGLYTAQIYAKTDGTSSFFILRIAEQYLIRAEARAKKGNPDLAGAVSDLQAIQTRSDVTRPFELGDAASPGDVLLAIENERRLELAFEGHRFSDIVRTERAADVFGSINPLLKESYQWVFPIPQASIDKDPALKQNPGYDKASE